MLKKILIAYESLFMRMNKKVKNEIYRQIFREGIKGKMKIKEFNNAGNSYYIRKKKNINKKQKLRNRFKNNKPFPNTFYAFCLCVLVDKGAYIRFYNNLSKKMIDKVNLKYKEINQDFIKTLKD